MTEILTGQQVLALALLSNDEVPEIEIYDNQRGVWNSVTVFDWSAMRLRNSDCKFRIKPKPQRRISVTLANGEVVSWPEPVRVEQAPVNGVQYWLVKAYGLAEDYVWADDCTDEKQLAFGNIHLTREAAQEHADALRKINTQGVV